MEKDSPYYFRALRAFLDNHCPIFCHLNRLRHKTNRLSVGSCQYRNTEEISPTSFPNCICSHERHPKNCGVEHLVLDDL